MCMIIQKIVVYPDNSVYVNMLLYKHKCKNNTYNLQNSKGGN